MRKRMQNWAFGVALALLVVVVPVAGNAQELQIADFEGADQAKVSGGEVSAEQAKTGKASLKWTNQDKKNRVVFSNIPTDWTPYNQVSFWVYSPEERDLQLMLNAPSENTETEGPDYYSNRFKVNWKGWRRVEIPFLYLSPSRKPLGLDQVKYLAIYASGWGIKADPEAVLYIDDVRFEKAEIKAGNLSFEDDPVGSSTVSGWNANPGPNGKDNNPRDRGRRQRGQGPESRGQRQENRPRCRADSPGRSRQDLHHDDVEEGRRDRSLHQVARRQAPEDRREDQHLQEPGSRRFREMHGHVRPVVPPRPSMSSSGSTRSSAARARRWSTR